jgi:hypothetical protein
MKAKEGKPPLPAGIMTEDNDLIHLAMHPIERGLFTQSVSGNGESQTLARRLMMNDGAEWKSRLDAQYIADTLASNANYLSCLKCNTWI